jgi:ribosomal protein S12 methylthiotransferase accessory factor
MQASAPRSMICLQDFERSVSFKDALLLLSDASQAIENRFCVEFFDYPKGASHVAYARDASGCEIAYGLGKGTHSRLGAYGECIEHLVYDRIGFDSSVPIPKAEYLHAAGPCHDVIMSFALNLPSAPDQLFCTEFRSLANGATIYIPREFVNFQHFGDDYLGNDYTLFLSRYVTNSGTAFGFALDDALLHALNELIERDATSRFLMSMLGLQNPAVRYFRLDPESLPHSLSLPLSSMRACHNPEHIELYCCRTPFGPWWSFAICRFGGASHFRIPQWGAGASFSLELALYRSLSECLQMLDCFDSGNADADDVLLHKGSIYPFFRDVAHMNTRGLATAIEMTNYASIISDPQHFTVLDQVSALVDRMDHLGHSPAIHVAHHEHGLAVCTAFAPNLERFYNVTKGFPALPLALIARSAQQ